MKSFFFALIFFATIFLSACDPNYIRPTPNSSVPLQDLTQYSFFKTGTYWIYKDSATGIEDSVYVYSDTAYSYYNSGSPIIASGNYMYYECKAHSSFDSYNYYYQIDLGYYGSDHLIGTWRVKTKPGDYVGTTFMMSNHFVENYAIYAWTSPGTIRCKWFKDTWSIGGTVFHTVVKFQDTKNASEYESPTNFFIAKNIGIIRKEKLDTTQAWNLIRYHIIQ